MNRFRSQLPMWGSQVKSRSFMRQSWSSSGFDKQQGVFCQGVSGRESGGGEEEEGRQGEEEKREGGAGGGEFVKRQGGDLEQ